jgi:hypothetical protein
MSPVKAIAILFFVVSLALAGLALKNAYDAYVEQTNTDVSRATHVITESGSYQYIYSVDVKMVKELKADAWSYTLYFVLTLAIGAILWGLAEVSDKLKQRNDLGG